MTEQPSQPAATAPGQDSLVSAMAELEAALSSARLDCKLDQIGAARSVAFRAHSAAELAGFSEAASTLLYVEETLSAMVEGEIAATAANWRQVDAAWRSAESLTRASLVPPVVPPTPVERRILVYERGSTLSAILERRTSDEHYAITRLESARELTELAGSHDVVIVDWDHWSPDDVSALANRNLIVVGSDDALETRLAAARAGARTFLGRREIGGQLRSAVRSLCLRSEPRRVLAIARPEIAARIRDAFCTADFDFTASARAEELLDQMQAARPDALLLDGGMSSVDALELCRVLRAAPRWEDLPITVVSDSSQRATDAFTAGADDAALLSRDDEQLAHRIRSLIDRVDRARARASRDVLTGLLTRRAFVDAMEGRLAEARRGKKYLSLCLIDIDHFKRINDSHGHAAGDEVLATIGALFNSRFRQEDLRGRWGGEEFVVAFFDEWSESARQVLSRASAELASLEFSGAKGETFSCTMSAGIAAFPVDGQNLEELFRAADARLYHAKASGRNRIVI